MVVGGSIAAGGGSDWGDHCVASAHTRTCVCVCPSQVSLPGHQKKLMIRIRQLREKCELQ